MSSLHLPGDPRYPVTDLSRFPGTWETQTARQLQHAFISVHAYLDYHHHHRHHHSHHRALEPDSGHGPIELDAGPWLAQPRVRVLVPRPCLDWYTVMYLPTLPYPPFPFPLLPVLTPRPALLTSRVYREPVQFPQRAQLCDWQISCNPVQWEPESPVG